MSQKLADYILLLAQNPQETAKLKQSRASATAAMTAAGLSPAEQDVLATNDPQKINAAVVASFKSAGGPQAGMMKPMNITIELQVTISIGS